MFQTISMRFNFVVRPIQTDVQMLHNTFSSDYLIARQSGMSDSKDNQCPSFLLKLNFVF